jgi:hypothetical protein
MKVRIFPITLKPSSARFPADGCDVPTALEMKEPDDPVGHVDMWPASRCQSAVPRSVSLGHSGFGGSFRAVPPFPPPLYRPHHSELSPARPGGVPGGVPRLAIEMHRRALRAMELGGDHTPSSAAPPESLLCQIAMSICHASLQISRPLPFPQLGM